MIFHLLVGFNFILVCHWYTVFDFFKLWMHMRVDGRLTDWYANALTNPTRQRRRCYMRPLTQPITGTRVESLHPLSESSGFGGGASQPPRLCCRLQRLNILSGRPTITCPELQFCMPTQSAAAAPSRRQRYNGYIILYNNNNIIFCFESFPSREARQSFTA